jgi:hypothetical protein
MSLGAVVLDEQDRYSRGARFAEQNRNIRQNTILQFGRHKPHQTHLNIDDHQRGFQSALHTRNGQREINCTAKILLQTVGPDATNIGPGTPVFTSRPDPRS